MDVFDALRFRSLLEARGVTQSELARRVGISQASIYRLAAGDAYGSKHLHRIARELGTTAAYLAGETDDPEADAPAPPEQTSEVRDLVGCFESLPVDQRRAVLMIVQTMAGQFPPPGKTRRAVPSRVKAVDVGGEEAR